MRTETHHHGKVRQSTDQTAVRVEEGSQGEEPSSDCTRGGLEGASGETDADLKQILISMQQSLTKIDGKIDDLTYRMD
ncbi:hypothetical protein NDU88_008958 [Pleurodeles waltl]|uniref:Uncharacterized protein n=1 Tax=Pleurodeles waltl TaxID=8319 RepID=A0AAV7PTM5_PLEWA|nr:hypothetical protein NDU88_008958 [Pleurodeles waltl]